MNKKCVVFECNRLDMNSSQHLINDFLDDYSLCEVLSFLPIMEQINGRLVCKRWHHLLTSLLNKRSKIGVALKQNKDTDDSCSLKCELEPIWHTIDANDCVSANCRTIKDGSRRLFIVEGKILNVIFKCCPNLTTLSLTHTIIDRSIWQLFQTSCPQLLQHIDFSYSQGLIDEVIRFIAVKCGETLRHVILVDSDVSESSLKVLIESCPNLQYLDLSENVRITGLCFSLLNNNFKQLSINYCWSIQMNGIMSLTDALGLNKLEIIGEFVSDHMLETICDRLKQLKCLQIDSSNVYNRKVLTKMADLSNLEELIVYFPMCYCDSVLIAIIKRCNKLRKLSLEGGLISDLSLSQFGSYGTQLQTVSIGNQNVRNKKITDACCDSLSRLTNLTHLDIQYTNISDGLIKIVKNCPQLSTIEIDGCKLVTNNFIKACIEMVQQNANRNITVFARNTRLDINTDFSEIPVNLIFKFD